MKILIATGIYPPDIGGPATYSKILFEELPKRGVAADVLSFGEVRSWPPIVRHLLFFIKVLFAGKSADIIFAQDPVSVGLPAMLGARILGKRFFLKIVGDFAWEQGVQRFGIKELLDDFLDKKYGPKVELLRKIEKFVANGAEQIIVPSLYLKKVVEKWGIAPEKIQVIYNAFEPADSGISKSGAREKLGLSLSDKIIVSAGRDVPWKGYRALRELMPEIQQEFPDAKLFIFSNEPHEKLLLFLLAADVFVLNTSYEGLSHQILEAMAAGCPVVTTDVGGNPELISDGETGLLVKFDDKNALKSKIIEVLCNDSFALKLAQNAQKKAQEFSLGRMVENTCEVLTQARHT